MALPNFISLSKNRTIPQLPMVICHSFMDTKNSNKSIIHTLYNNWSMYGPLWNLCLTINSSPFSLGDPIPKWINSALMSCSANHTSESKVTYISIYYVESAEGTCSSGQYIAARLWSSGWLSTEKCSGFNIIFFHRHIGPFRSDFHIAQSLSKRGKHRKNVKHLNTNWPISVVGEDTWLPP